MTPKGNTLKAGPLNQTVLFFALAGWLHMGAHPTGRLSTRMARDPNYPEEEENTNSLRLQTAFQSARPSHDQLYSKLTRGYSNPPQAKIVYPEAQAGNKWRAITQDQWVLEVVRGFQILFSSSPPIGTRLPPFLLPLQQQSILIRKIEEMQACGDIREVVNPQAGFTSNVFLVAKKGGDWRPIINFKILNQYVAK